MSCRIALAVSIAVLFGALSYLGFAVHFGKTAAGPAAVRLPVSWAMIRIGMEAGQLHKNMGPPFACTVSGAGMQYLADEKLCFDTAEVRRTGLNGGDGADVPLDVYHWKTSLNDYELHIFFAPDDRQSKLHPVFRVSHFDIILERTMPVTELLADIPDPLNWCSTSCQLILENNDQSAIGLGPEFTLSAYSPQPDLDSAELASFCGMGGFYRIARSRAPKRSRNVKIDWVPAVYFSLDSSDSFFGNRSPAAMEWLSAPVKSVEFSAEALAFKVPIVGGTSLGSFRELLTSAKQRGGRGH
jgi:hypothetical protein